MKTLKMLIRKGLIWIFGFFCIATFAQAQAISDAEIHQLIQELKRDPRGPTKKPGRPESDSPAAICSAMPKKY